MRAQTFTPAQVATMLDVNAMTVRRWVAAHADHLSDGAKSVPRRLSGRDVDVLAHVATLRAQHLTTDAINERLANITFVEVEEPDANAQEKPLQRIATPQQEAQGELLLPMLAESINQRMDALQRQIERVERHQRERVVVFGLGVGVGLVAAILLLLIVYMLMNV